MKHIRLLLPLLLIALLISACDSTSLSDPNDDDDDSSLPVLDVHGAGAQRSDQKSGSASEYPEGHGPQGDVVRINNFVRLVRSSSTAVNDYPIVDTGQSLFYNNTVVISPPSPGADFYGQDSTHSGLQPSYTDNLDGTVTDNNTGLMWVQTPDRSGNGSITAADKLSYSQASNAAASFSLAGHNDWRLPTIKELYSLILFSGEDPSGYSGTSTNGLVPFIDTAYFDFAYGDTASGERLIDAQFASLTRYVSTTMNNDPTMFGVNFADGRIKGYPLTMGGSDKTFYVIYVRGNTSYGINNFTDNGDGTVSDLATGLMWDQDDSLSGMDWQTALAWVAQMNATNYKGYSDWRLPNAKELQSIVDYTRSPDTTASAAIDPVFNCTQITDEGGNANYAFYWSGTTHAAYNGSGAWACYLAFGEALGYMDLSHPPP